MILPESATAVTDRQSRVCLSVDGQLMQDGQAWFDGCRKCYCYKGLEMCELITCPAPRCVNPVIPVGSCCPVCPEGGSVVLMAGGAGCNETDEGHIWHLDKCTQCICHQSGVLCETESCPPLLCHHSITLPDKCCPVCPDDTATFLFTKNLKSCESGFEVPYHDGDQWRPDPCRSCVCHSGQIQCFSQTCPQITCNKTLLRKGQCCPHCLDSHKASMCKHGGRHFHHGDIWLLGDCRSCMCQNGYIICSNTTCDRPEMCALHSEHCCSQCQVSGSIDDEMRLQTEGHGRFASFDGYLLVIGLLVSMVIFLTIVVCALVPIIQRLRHTNSQYRLGGLPPAYTPTPVITSPAICVPANTDIHKVKSEPQFVRFNLDETDEGFPNSRASSPPQFDYDIALGPPQV